jgi:FkbM family methyltransferase
MRSNGEAYVQRSVLAACGDDAMLNIVDIGANQGEWTLLLAEQAHALARPAGSITVDLFEPVPSTIERLEPALRPLDGRLIYRVHPLAMSDTSGKVRINIMSETGGTNSLHGGADARAAPGRFIEIDTGTLDEFCAGRAILHLHLAKCDTEGHDLNVLRGARGLLTAGQVDAFQFEYNHRWVFARSFLRDVFDLAAGLPYSVARIMPDHIETLPAWHPELERYFEANYMLVHERALPWFSVKAGRFDDSNVYCV